MRLALDESRILNHIIKNNGSQNVKSKKQRSLCVSLYRKGYLKRRIGDYEWVWSGKKYNP